LPVAGGQARAHFDAAFLAGTSPAVIDLELQAVTGAELLSIQVSELNTVVAIVTAGGTGRGRGGGAASPDPPFRGQPPMPLGITNAAACGYWPGAIARPPPPCGARGTHHARSV